MLKNLVIVESPAKAKTIEKFLGKDYKVMSSYGHIRDLRKKDISIKVDSDFQPVYEIPADKKNLVAELKKAAKEAETVWLASDEDREGEAIAWHLYEVLGLKPENTKRIVFHEITKNAILNAIEQPRDIDLHLVDAQQARRVLDRLVGFELSPVLWKKIKPALSAGRVQSVAVRLIVDRENEINAFTSEPYYRVTALFNIPGHGQLRAELSKRLPDEESAREFLEACRKSVYTVTDINVKPLRKSPAPPFTTSTLQQEAGRKLGFTVSQTMMIAQKLYEAGFITYMRTDSLNLSQLAINSISKLITDELGEEYLKVRRYHTNSKGAQEAHEAIRPTYIDKETIEGSAQEKRLYRLIRLRTMASQMADAELEKTTVDITPSERSEHFTASGEVIKFDGFLKVYLEGKDDEEAEAEEGMLPPLKTGEVLTADNVTATERSTLAPPRYTESSLVKKMEELGIGRPSTYAPTISTIQHREYIVKGEKPGEKRSFKVLTLKEDGKITSGTKTESVGAEKGKLIPTDTGIIVNEFLTEHFPDILDYDFTADMEQKFDRIAEGETNWNQEIARFYGLFHPEVEKANDLRTEHKVGERLLGTDPTTGEPVSVKIGRFGPIVQIGSAESKDKPRFASLRKDQSVFDIELADALKLFELPRHVGEFEGKEVIAAVGRFGPYLRHDGKFVSIPKDLSPTSITIEEAEELIKAKREADSNKVVKTFEEDPEIQILNGRYGVYIAYKKSNYKIPKSVENPADLTIEQVRQLIEEQDKAPKRPARRAAGGSRSKKS
ncbi:MAG: type I DNA topoisomerase [Duncaniella sp.]|nr:type I DNA topoisomerase [Duncaniella sp.]MDE7475328.1 type I DNA topoisomerase [Duncaniella sp.]